MDKVDIAVEMMCAAGIILAPLWLGYKFILCML